MDLQVVLVLAFVVTVGILMFYSLARLVFLISKGEWLRGGTLEERRQLFLDEVFGPFGILFVIAVALLIAILLNHAAGANRG